MNSTKIWDIIMENYMSPYWILQKENISSVAQQCVCVCVFVILMFMYDAIFYLWYSCGNFNLILVAVVFDKTFLYLNFLLKFKLVSWLIAHESVMHFALITVLETFDFSRSRADTIFSSTELWFWPRLQRCWCCSVYNKVFSCEELPA